MFATGPGQAPDRFDDKIADHFDVSRVPDDPPLAEPGQLRAGAHTDFGTLTLVHPTEAGGGREVLSPDGRWIPVPAMPEALVMNIGDRMQRWTNGRWRSTLHRVVNPLAQHAEDTRRYSSAFFCHPAYDATVECLPGCMAAGDAPAHPPVNAGEWMRARMLAVREGRATAA